MTLRLRRTCRRIGVRDGFRFEGRWLQSQLVDERRESNHGIATRSHRAVYALACWNRRVAQPLTMSGVPEREQANLRQAHR